MPHPRRITARRITARVTTHTPAAPPDHTPRADRADPALRRIASLAVALAAIEAVLYLVGWVSPALAGLMRPLYVVAIALFIRPLWNAARSRSGQDRRRGERREERRGGP